MASEDWLGPQFAGQPDFNPGKQDVWGGSAYSYSRTDPETGQTVRNSRAMSNMLGKNAASDTELNIPTGATTDFQVPDPSKLFKFRPNDLGNASGVWN